MSLTEPVVSREQPKVFLVILNRNGWEDTIACLDSNYEGDYRWFEAVVVDNDSTDGSLQKIRDWARRKGAPIKADITLRGGEEGCCPIAPFSPSTLTLIETGKNLGYSGGNNRGFRYALQNGADLIFQLNNDVVVERNSLTRLVGSIQTDPRMAVVYPLILGLEGENQVPAYLRPPFSLWELLINSNLLGFFWSRLNYHEYLKQRNPYPGYQYDRLLPVPNVAGACCLYRRELFEQIGLLDESVFMYHEEAILIQKLRKAHFIACLDPSTKVLHKGGRDNAKLPPAFLYTRRVCGEIYYAQKYLGVSRLGQWLLMSLRFMEYSYHMLKSPEYRGRFSEFMRLYLLGRT